MMIRLVLVSVVACLGLTLTNVERSRRSGLAWRSHVGSAEAERVAREEGRFIVVADALNVVVPRSEEAAAESDDQALQAAWLEAIERELAPPSATDEDPSARPFAAVEPVVEVEDPAFEENWLAAIEREAAPPSAVEMDLAFADERVAQTEVKTDDPAFEAAWASAIEREAAPPSAVEMDLAFADERTVAAAPAPAVVDAVELAWWDAWLAELSEPLPAEAPAEAAAAVLPAPPTAGDTEFRAIVEEMAGAFARDAETLTARARSDQQQPAPAIFEPMEVEDSASDVAYALNREAEGLTLPAPAPVPVAKLSTPRENRLTHAMRLTRDAVNAWAAVLHGPALVSIGR